MQFDLVSPERRLASLEATSVLIPGAEGDMTVMADHAPVITTLRPGVLVVEADGGTQEFVVTGGFAEINASGVSVLAEMAASKADASAIDLDALVSEARDAAASAEGSAKDMADKQLADLEALVATA